MIRPTRHYAPFGLCAVHPLSATILRPQRKRWTRVTPLHPSQGEANNLCAIVASSSVASIKSRSAVLYTPRPPTKESTRPRECGLFELGSSRQRLRGQKPLRSGQNRASDASPPHLHHETLSAGILYPPPRNLPARFAPTTPHSRIQRIDSLITISV